MPQCWPKGDFNGFVKFVVFLRIWGQSRHCVREKLAILVRNWPLPKLVILATRLPGSPEAPSTPAWGVLGGSVTFWVALGVGRSGWLCDVLGGFGVFRVALGRSGWLWGVLGGSEAFWVALGRSGWLWGVLGGWLWGVLGN